MLGACAKVLKLSSRASLLECDNVKLKGMTNSYRWCARYDLTEEENARHILIRCPAYQEKRNSKFSQIWQVKGD